ncbi:unnamed protein product [Strongylus vulgaris]|uniref:Cadherin domain-containing protein n=1 Tax=Strongylus vulgaris TaxID=40348 RepID=A0A3P7J617_STRVU|nr:unnamed protein product [Strongylus vulgaris]
MILLLFVLLCHSVLGITFVVPESSPVGHVIGYLEGRPTLATQAKYFVVYPDTISEQVSACNSECSLFLIVKIDEKSGEITLIAPLDYEKHKKFEILAVPIDGGEGIQATVEVEDVNDHTPTFPEERIKLEISEFARIGAAYPLPRAEDADGQTFTVQKYRIAQGNVNNVFKVAVRPVNGVLYAELVVNGQLDREYRDMYELIVEAIDGGTPANIVTLSGCPSLCLRQSQSPSVYLLLVCGLFDRESSPEYHLKFSLKRGNELVLEHPVLLTIGKLLSDINDNAPIWSHSHMHITLNRSIAISDQTTSLVATDPDEGTNGRVRYSILNSDVIAIDPDTGRLTPLRELDCSLGQEIRFKVRASDGGVPSLYSGKAMLISVITDDSFPTQNYTTSLNNYRCTFFVVI